MLVAGIDSSTQSCKVTVRDAGTGVAVREGKAAHPSGTIVDPTTWWDALLLAVQRAGGLHDVAALAVSAQQHTPIFLSATGEVVRPSPLWNDAGSHPHMTALNAELGATEWIRRTGLPLTISDTVTKVRWLRDEHPLDAHRTAAVVLVHDWLTWRLLGHGPDDPALDALVTDRSDAAGTGYWSPDTGDYHHDLFTLAFGRSALLPRVLGPLDTAGRTGTGIPGVPPGIPVSVGSGDNAAAALALGVGEGDAVLSLGTSGVVYVRSDQPVHDLSGAVCNYADATGRHLPLAATMNAARNLDAGAALLGCDVDELSRLALSAPPGAGGLTLLPYFEGERMPDLPDARASLHGATLANFTPGNLARAVIEGTIASQLLLLDALRRVGMRPERLLIIGGAAQSPAVQRVLTENVDMPVVVPAADEYVAKGAAAQAVAVLTGGFPRWDGPVVEVPATASDPVALTQFRTAADAMGYPIAPALDPVPTHKEMH